MESRLSNARHTNPETRKHLFKSLVEHCTRVHFCPNCNQPCGTVKKGTRGFMTLVHDNSSNNDDRGSKLIEYQEAIKNNPEIASHINKSFHTDLTPLMVFNLFRKIRPHHAVVMMLPADPERLILTHMPVPPVCIRPSVMMGNAGTQEDDLSAQMVSIIGTNNAISGSLEKGGTMKQIAEQWAFLSASIALCFNSDATGLAASISLNKPIRSICTRLKGKEGRFRGNLSGKRVNFTGRTVISPDPNIEVTEVGVPFRAALRLTYPEVVNMYNMDIMKQKVINGSSIYPGAQYIRSQGRNRSATGNHIKNLSFVHDTRRKELAENLQYGDIVDRHLQNGDLVLFNRQPSLHRISIMCHRVRVMPTRTLRFNECVCAPYNADFDGDEMNIHLPQTEEARTEAFYLMGVQRNLITPKNGEPIVSATQDFLTASFLITQRDTFFTRDKFVSLICYINNAREYVRLPAPAIMKPVELWTGKQVFSILLRPNEKCKVSVFLEMTEKNFDRKNRYFCENDGYVIFRNSELLSGNLGKKVLGEAKPGLFFVLIRDNSPAVAAACLGRLSRMCARWLGTRGFTLGIDDVTPTDDIISYKKLVVEEKYEVVNQLIKNYQCGNLQALPGSTREQTMETLINSELGTIRNIIGDELQKVLPRLNKPRIMAQCGSKGSAINLSQMMLCLGQQNVGGKRILDGFVKRSLPHFEKNSRSPASRGFVPSSFCTGLKPHEFFFHTMGGREGLVDTAVKTAETGYMQRKLMKALEDVSLKYDMTVRTSAGNIVQFMFGDDGLNPSMMEGLNKPLDFEHLFLHAKSLTRTAERQPTKSESIPFLPREYEPRIKEMIPIIESSVSSFTKVASDDTLSAFTIELISFIEGEKKKMEEERLKRGLPIDQRCKCSENEFVLNDLDFSLNYAAAETFMKLCARKYRKALSEPGEVVGATAAQSIGEPATQMTLKTFHFAGVASMNVTLGVPRLKEIINAAKNISTPIIKCSLLNSSTEMAAKIVKSKMQPHFLADVTKSITEVYEKGGVYVRIRIDVCALRKLELGIDMRDIRAAIIKKGALPKGVKVTEESIEIIDSDVLLVKPITSGPNSNNELLFALKELARSVGRTMISGLESVRRVVIHKELRDKPMGLIKHVYSLLIEGGGLSRILALPGVDPTKTASNHIMEIQSVLGIESARFCIMSEIDTILKQFGMIVDYRHIQMLADCMTYRGECLGINRYGIAKMFDSTLMLASFEKTSDFIFEAATFGKEDTIVGVSESIIMGNSVHVGTGIFKLLQEVPSHDRSALEFSRRIPLLMAT